MLISFASLQALTSAYSQSDFFGKIIMSGLFALSGLCWIILCYKIWQAQKVKSSAAAFQSLIQLHKEQILSLEPSDIPSPGPSYIPHPFAQIYFALKDKALEILHKKLYFLKHQKEKKEEVYLTTNDIEALEQHVSIAISSQYKLLEKHLFILSTIVTLAPFLGLLGTVWGILITFAELHTGGTPGSNNIILGGLSTALATTVLGLIIAIPALIAYNYLRNNLRAFASDMEDFLCSLISILELQYRKVDIE